VFCPLGWEGIHVTAAGRGVMTMLAIVFVVVYSES
jgi:hypothetical protein